ncbi:SKP1-like protein 14 [Argentina anserina]|uniref:SKP1-like protein 14 n=1 Tax=Argentina anserina TaxID=57926 RepID=UPI0021764924|nr:SKP1-like protein 14 [Potentilla anserina]
MSTEEDTVQEKKTISLKTSDDEVFELEENVAMEFGTVKAFFGDDGVPRDMMMPIPNVHSKELTRIIDFCTKHLDLKPKAELDEAGKKELRKFYKEYMKEDTTERIMELILAADYLNVNDFLDLLNQTVADRISNKSVEYVRKLFGIESDYTPEEEEALREQYAWAFEGVDEDPAED